MIDQRFSSPEDTVSVSVQKSCFGGVSIGVGKQTHIMFEHRKILNMLMLKVVKLSYGNVRLHLATPEICQARNLSSNPGIE